MSTLCMELPSSYVDVDSEEMEYISGGGSVSLYISASTIRYAITCAGWAIGSFLGAMAGNALVGPVGTKLGARIGGFLGGVIGSALANYVAGKVVNSGVNLKYNNWVIPGNYNLYI